VKSQFAERETLGTLLAETKEAHVVGDKIEDGDLIKSMGGSYMRELIDAAESPEMPEQFYVMAIWEKTPIEKGRTISFVFVKRTTIPPMEPATEVYYIDKGVGHIELLWSLPEYRRMNDVLSHPNDYDSQTVFSVKKYKELEAKSKKHPLLI